MPIKKLTNQTDAMSRQAELPFDNLSTCDNLVHDAANIGISIIHQAFLDLNLRQMTEENIRSVAILSKALIDLQKAAKSSQNDLKLVNFGLFLKGKNG